MKNLKMITLFLAINFLLSCNMDGQNWSMSGIKGEGPKVTKTFDLESFDALSLNINATVFLSQEPGHSVKIEAQQNIIDNIVKEVRNGTWKIKFNQNVRRHDGIKIWVNMQHLTRLAVSGSGDVEGQTAFKNLNDLQLAVSGSGDIELDSESRSLEAAISGSGGMSLAGITGDCRIRISGSGDVDAFNLASETCSVKISGSGDASVNASKNLEVGIAGSGDVYYKGNPRVKSKISGSGDVTAK